MLREAATGHKRPECVPQPGRICSYTLHIPTSLQALSNGSIPTPFPQALREATHCRSTHPMDGTDLNLGSLLESPMPPSPPRAPVPHPPRRCQLGDASSPHPTSGIHQDKTVLQPRINRSMCRWDKKKKTTHRGVFKMKGKTPRSQDARTGLCFPVRGSACGGERREGHGAAGSANHLPSH